MSWFWKMLSHINVRLLLALSVSGLLAVLAWRIRFEIDQERLQGKDRVAAIAADAPVRAASAAAALPIPDEKSNPFESSYLSGMREKIKREQEQELAEQRRKTAEAARIAAETKTQPATTPPPLSDVAIPVVPVTPVAHAENNPRSMTVVYKGMLIRTDGVRLALIGKDAQDGYYPLGASIEWLAIQEFSRDTLSVKLGDQTVDLHREQPFTSQEP